MRLIVTTILVLICILLAGCGSYTFNAGASLQRTDYPSYGGIYQLMPDGGRRMILPNEVVQAPVSFGNAVFEYVTPPSTVGYSASIEWRISGTPVAWGSAPGRFNYGSPANGLQEVTLTVYWRDAVSGLALESHTFKFKVNSFRDLP
jgi:hypothetical protein